MTLNYNHNKTEIQLFIAAYDYRVINVMYMFKVSLDSMEALSPEGNWIAHFHYYRIIQMTWMVLSAG